MRKIILFLLFLLILLVIVILFFPVNKTHYVRAETPEESVENTIKYFASKFALDENLALTVAKCESDLKNTTRGDKGLARGIYQYHREAFDRHSQLFGEKLDYNSSYDQIKLATWALANGKGNEWTAYRAIQNGGKYSFYSKLLKENFTVYCK